MRPTKYRAWDTIDKKWMDDDWVLNQPIWMLQATESKYVFVQWTGLTDINNQPIYEGSIFLVETETDTEIFKKEDYPQDDDFTEDYTATTITKYYTILKSDGPLEWYTDGWYQEVTTYSNNAKPTVESGEWEGGSDVTSYIQNERLEELEVIGHILENPNLMETN